MSHNFPFDEQNREFWNEICGTTFAELNKMNLENINQIELFDKHYFEFYPYLFDELNWVLQGAKNCIEVGLGAGTVSRYLASRCSNYVGLDISDRSCNFVRTTFDNLKINGTILNRSILDIPDKSDLKKYDSAVAIGSLHHTGDLSLALANLESVVKPGGKILVMVYYYAQPKRILYNPLNFISNVINLLVHKQFHYKEKNSFVRKSSDKNLRGDPAPITTFSSRKLFSTRKDFKYSCSLQNSHRLGFNSIHVSRNFVLKHFSRFIGVHIYARGRRLH